MISEILLWSFVLNLGVVFGAGIYEARISVPRWLGPSRAAGPGWHAAEALRDDTGRRFWAFTTTVPLTLLTLANLWVGWRSADPIRIWWMTAALVALADRVCTFAYFIPRMVSLMRAADSSESRADMRQWANLNYGRQLLVLVAWLAALKTFAQLYTRSI
jgi:hypothetical protein